MAMIKRYNKLRCNPCADVSFGAVVSEAVNCQLKQMYRHVYVRSIDKIDDKRPRVRQQLASCSVYLIKEVQHITDLKLDIWVYLNVSKYILFLFL